MIYERIKTLCDDQGRSVSDLERSIGVARSSLSKIDKHKPSAEKMQKIAEELDVTTDFLFGKTDVVECPLCRYPYRPMEEPDRKGHREYHDLYCDTAIRYGDNFIEGIDVGAEIDAIRPRINDIFLSDEERDEVILRYVRLCFTQFIVASGFPQYVNFDDYAKAKIVEFDTEIGIAPKEYRSHVMRMYHVENDSDKKESTSGRAYYFDDDTAEAAQKMYENPELRALFDAADGVPKNVLVSVYNLLMSMKQHERGDSD